MAELPTPKRWVIGNVIAYPPNFVHFDLTTDTRVIEFVGALACVQSYMSLGSRHYTVSLDVAYCYDDASTQQTLAWISERLAEEFAGSVIPAREDE